LRNVQPKAHHRLLVGGKKKVALSVLHRAMRGKRIQKRRPTKKKGERTSSDSAYFARGGKDGQLKTAGK